jgi:predicted transcriptional regulator
MRSKLELCVDVLQVLVDSGPLKVTHILLKARVNHITLKPVLSKLLAESLVEEKRLKDDCVAFEITLRGRVVLEELVRFSKHCPVASLVFA